MQISKVSFAVVLVPFVLLESIAFAASVQSAQSFVYQGRFFNDSGTAPITETVSLTLSIYNPNLTCLLYQESQSGIDLSLTDGRFSVHVGSGLAPSVDAAKRTTDDPGKSMAEVFSNGSLIFPPGSLNCAPGYTPQAGDVRKLRVQFTPNAGAPVTLAPDLTIGSSPSATVAETLQGKGPDMFLQIQGTATQNNIGILTAGPTSNASGLHQHDNQYAKLSNSTSMTLGAGQTLGLGSSAAVPGASNALRSSGR